MIRFYFCLISFSTILSVAQPFDNVLSLAGQDDFIEIPNSLSSSFTNNITIEAWIKPCTVSGHRMILTKFYCVGNNNQFYFTVLDGKLRWAWDNTGCQDGANFYETGITVLPNVWQHVAVKHTPNSVTIYYNGSPIAGTLIQGAYSGMLNSSEPLRIGVYKTITGNWFGSYSGLIDEVRIWSSALTDGQILARYDTPLTGAEANLAGYYSMDLAVAGAGTVVPNLATVAAAGTSDGLALGNSVSPAFITSSNAIANSLFGNDTTICDGETLLLNAAGFTGDYLWQDGSTDTAFTVTQAGLYYVSITNGCEEFGDSIQVTYASIPSVNLGNDTLMCQGQTINLSAANVIGATDYIWQDSSVNSDFLVSQQGLYSVFVEVGGCNGYDEIQVNYSTLSLNLGPPDSVICNTPPFAFNVSQPNANYLWQDGSTNGRFLVQNDGIYKVTVSDGVCELEDSMTITINEILADFEFETTPQCGATPVVYTNLSSTNVGVLNSFTWSVIDQQPFFGPTPTQMVSTSGTQSVKLTVTSSFGCSAETSKSVPIQVFEQPTVNFTVSDLTPQIGEQVYFNNTSAFVDTIQWEFDNGYSTDSSSPSYTFLEEGLQRIQLTGFNSLCSSTVHKYIKVQPPLRYYVPNAFTPFNGQRNQFFSPIFTSGFDPYNYSLTIFNRWGEILFISENADFGWDGTYNSEPQKNGVYAWQIKYFDVELNERVTVSGTVNLIH